mgnify:CR=1 FL=1
MIDNIFLQIGVLLGITVTVAFLMRMLRQPLMTAYLIAGIVAGPFVLNLVQGDTEVFHALSQFGVILLLFVVGLSLNFDHIKRIGKVALTVGLTQVMFTAAIGYGILRSLNYEASSAMYLALALTFSSTIIIEKLLTDKKDLQSVYGRYTIGVMIVQDILALLIMIVLTSLSGDMTIGETIVDLIFNIVLLIAFVIVLARYVVPKIMDRVAESSEFLFLFTVAWCFGVASILTLLGFSIEVGALIAGLTLGSSPYQSEISSRVKPLRDFFIVIFFIILGSELSLAQLPLVVVPGLTLSAFILFGNPFILYRTFRALKFTRRNSFLSGVTAAQVSEFGFVLLFTGQQLGYIHGQEVEVFTLVALVTIILSSYAITYNEQLYKMMIPFFDMFGKDKYRQREDKAQKYDVWVFGYHRIGWKICEALAEKGKSFAVVDYNPAAIAKLKQRGIPAFFGDASDVEFLSQLPIEKAKMIISTLPEVDDQLTCIKHLRSTPEGKKVHIIANLYHIDALKEMYDAGASYVMMPHLVGGTWLSDILKNESWSKRTFSHLQKEQKEEMKMRYTLDMHK